MNRPFEVGDLAIGLHGVGIVIGINNEKQTVRIDLKGFEFKSWVFDFCTCKFSEITAIRKPRPGNPSSRAIVAMLGRQSRIAINNKANEVGWKFLKEFWKMGGTKEYQTAVFETAKSMLK